jgi:hypothetical protein
VQDLGVTQLHVAARNLTLCFTHVNSCRDLCFDMLDPTIFAKLVPALEMKSRKIVRKLFVANRAHAAVVLA